MMCHFYCHKQHFIIYRDLCRLASIQKRPSLFTFKAQRFPFLFTKALQLWRLRVQLEWPSAFLMERSLSTSMKMPLWQCLVPTSTMDARSLPRSKRPILPFSSAILCLKWRKRLNGLGWLRATLLILWKMEASLFGKRRISPNPTHMARFWSKETWRFTMYLYGKSLHAAITLLFTGLYPTKHSHSHNLLNLTNWSIAVPYHQDHSVPSPGVTVKTGS